MTLTAPDWLTTRSVELKPSRDGHSVTVHFNSQAQYLLEPLPAKGQYSCKVLQIVNGKRLDQGGTYESFDAALQGGLDDLRQALGW